MPLAEKRCTWCSVVKAASDFYARLSSPSGLTSHCRSCQKASAKRSDLRDRVRGRAKRKRWKMRHPEKNAALESRLKKRAYQRDPDKFKTRVRVYAEKNRDAINERMASPDGRLRRRLNEGRRRARMRGKITPAQWRAALEAWGHACSYCGVTRSLHLDHFVPLARGGAHEIYNAVPACEQCNKSKGARDPWEFLHSRRTMGVPISGSDPGSPRMRGAPSW